MLHHGRRAALANSAAPPDAQFNYVTMLLHGDGTNGAQNNTFLDSSTNNFTITRNGNTTQGTFAPYGSNWGNYFGATGQYLSVPYSSAFNLTGDFTIEFWINPGNLPSTTSTAAQSYERIFSFGTYNAANSLGLEINSNDSGNVRKLLSWYNGTGYSVSTNNAVSPGVWYHIAMVRSGTTITTYINGTSTGLTITGASAAVNTSQSFYIASLQGYESDSSAAYNGYISNFRIVKGTAVYTSNFTPSTTPLTAISGTSLLTCQSNRFIDNSASPLTITTSGTPSVQRFNPFGASTAYSTSVIGGSGYFDGTDDYLSYTQQTYSGNFTMECWVYQIASSSSYAMLFSVGGANTQLMIDYSGTGKITFYYNSTAISSASGVFIRNQWNHIAYVRSGSTITIYYNGTSVASGTLSDAIPVSLFGGYSSSGYTLNGYMSDVRITTSALYTTTFTPPTAPLTAISGTSLLLGMTNGAIFDNAMMNDLETVGNAQISTSVVKYGTGSLAFDGTGDYLAGPYSPNLDFGTGDFTVELWFYFNGSVTGAGFIGSKNTGGMDFAFTSSSLRIGRINTAWDSTFSWSPSANTWYHIAFTRSNGTARAFVNGTQVGSDSSNTNNYYPNGGIYVGVSAPPDRYINGYIDDLRITKGYARYTATFTPPTAAFPNIGPV